MADFAELVYGSLAYDPFGAAAPNLDAPAYPEEAPYSEPQAQPIPAARPRERVSIRTGAESRTRAKAGIPLLAVLGIPVALVCLYLLLQTYIQLTALSAESAQLETRIAALQENRARLEIQYESAFNMAEVEQYAKTHLGMVKADSEQISYIHNRSGDRAVVLHTPAGEAGPLDRVTAFFQRIKAYLH